MKYLENGTKVLFNESFERFRLSLDVVFATSVQIAEGSDQGKKVRIVSSWDNLTKAVLLGRHAGYKVNDHGHEKHRVRIDPWS